MNEFSDFSSVQYAVIKGPHTETGNERIVIAYPDEESLRDLIAAPSILAVGFSTRGGDIGYQILGPESCRIPANA